MECRKVQKIKIEMWLTQKKKQNLYNEKRIYRDSSIYIMPGSILSAFLDAMEEKKRETELHCTAHVSSTKGVWIYKGEVNRYLFGGKGIRVIACCGRKHKHKH